MDPESQQRNELQQQLGQLLQRQRDLVEQMRSGQQHFQQLARSVWRVQEEERRRLARELHDGLGQNLSAIVTLIDHALNAHAAPIEPARAGLEKARDLAQATLKETRAMSRLLRPQILDDLGLAAALRWLARSQGEDHGLDILLDMDQAPSSVENELATLIFRVVQESLTNVARHAKAHQVQISLRQHETHIALVVHDNGVGCDVAAALAANSSGRSSGLGGMRDRVRLYDGEFTLRSRPGDGFTMSISLPLRTHPGAPAP
jgi:two-component system NarL family sensor kinase